MLHRTRPPPEATNRELKDSQVIVNFTRQQQGNKCRDKTVGLKAGDRGWRRYDRCAWRGRIAWLSAPSWKGGVGQPTGGSNPPLSAIVVESTTFHKVPRVSARGTLAFKLHRSSDVSGSTSMVSSTGPRFATTASV
jgi:hypothetical protein